MAKKYKFTKEACEHERLDHMLGLGIGFYVCCRGCGGEWQRVATGEEPEDWEYVELPSETEVAVAADAANATRARELAARPA